MGNARSRYTAAKEGKSKSFPSSTRVVTSAIVDDVTYTTRVFGAADGYIDQVSGIAWNVSLSCIYIYKRESL